MVFSYTKLRKLSMGNHHGYMYSLTAVDDDSTSTVRTPFKKILGYMIEGTTTATTTIRVVSNTDSNGTTAKEAALVLDAGTDEDSGHIVIWGLM